MEPFVVALLIAISVLGLVVLFGVWNVWYRHVHGYSFITRIRRSRSKTAILASVVEEEDSDSSDEEYPGDSIFNPGDASSTITPSGSSHTLNAPAADAPKPVLPHLPAELWLDIVILTGPLQHARAVTALRTSCRSMRRVLDGAPFWQALCTQAFEPWSSWMTAMGWIGLERPAPSGGGDAGPTTKPSRGQSVVERRAWQARYVSCGRDQLLLRAAARQLFSAAGPIEHYSVLNGPSIDDDDGKCRVGGCRSAVVPTACSSSAAAADEGAARAPARAGSLLPHVGRARWADGSTDGDEGNGHAYGRAARDADHDVDSLREGKALPPPDEEDDNSLHECVGVLLEAGGHLSLWGYHVAELPALRALWGGKGATATQVAKALMRRQQWRVDSLSSRVAQSCHSQRRLVPMWQRVRPDEMRPDGARSGHLHAGHAAGHAAGGDEHADGATDGGCNGRWEWQLHRLHALLATGRAGQPECWVAHLAKGGLLSSRRAASSCWMLVLTTTRHAVWIDFFGHDATPDWLLEEEEI